MPRRRKWRPFVRPAKCDWCGKDFEASRDWQRFDARKCQTAAMNAERMRAVRFMRRQKRLKRQL